MNSVVLITGASSGLGKELAKIYLNKGYKLVLSGRHEEGLKEFEGEKNVEIVVGDLTKQETLDKLTNTVKIKFGRIDILINNAGIIYEQLFEENTPAQLDEIMEINLKVPMLLTQKIYPIMKAQKQGKIININSKLGKEGRAYYTLYSASKFGLYGFTQTLRAEAKEHGIRVLSVHPGGIKTGLYDSLPEHRDISGFMDAKEVADIIVYLSEREGLSPDEIVINRMTK